MQLNTCNTQLLQQVVVLVLLSTQRTPWPLSLSVLLLLLLLRRLQRIAAQPCETGTAASPVAAAASAVTRSLLLLLLK
jgi:hypothetical protein